jgi:hypothetical protein
VIRGSLLAVLLAASPALAVTRYADGSMGADCTSGNYSIASRNCTGTDGNAYNTLQEGLDATGNSDTLYIRLGSYTGDFECCGHGDATTEHVTGTVSAPTRVLGYNGEAVTLTGTTGQTSISYSGPLFSLNTATFQFRCDGGSDGTCVASTYAEFGGVTIVSGNSAAVSFPKVSFGYLHDVVVSDVTNYTQGNGEAFGVIQAESASNVYVNNVDITPANTGGALKSMNLFMFHGAADVYVRDVNASGFAGGIEQGHYQTRNLTTDFVRVLNWRPWTDDDGGLRDSYNSPFYVARYVAATEAAGGGHVLYGYFNSRPNGDNGLFDTTSLYVVNTYISAAAKRIGDAFGCWHHHDTFDSSEGQTNDWRVFNSACDTVETGLLKMPDGGATSAQCQWHQNAYNACVNITNCIDDSRDSTCGPFYDIGTGTVVATNKTTAGVNSDLSLTSVSSLRDTGYPGTYGSTLYFPPPVGGGARVDIGAYEFGAGSWPYEFQVQKTIAKNPSTTAIRICWNTSASSCDFTLPLWDSSAIGAFSSRTSTVDQYWIDVDPSNGFRSGGTGAAAGFRALYAAQQGSTAVFHDIPAGTLTDGQSYYVRVRVGEQVTPATNGSGPGPWSLGFYRFTVNSSGSSQTCGDGSTTGTETCDDGDQIVTPCVYDDAPPFTQVCDADCIENVNCDSPKYCGDGAINAGTAEECDGAAFGGVTCASLGCTGTIACTTGTYASGGCRITGCTNCTAQNCRGCVIRGGVIQ